MQFFYWVRNNIEWFAVFLAALLLLFDWFDAFARYIWHVHIKRKASPIGALARTGRPSKEYLGHLTFTIFTDGHEVGGIEGWAANEVMRSWSILVRETLPSRIRRRFTFAKAPTEMDFIEVAYRRTIPPQQGHIASVGAQEFQTLILRRTGFYRISVNTTRENVSPGQRVVLECGATVVKMGVRYVNDDNAPDGNITLGQ